jgi:hypothetical protein
MIQRAPPLRQWTTRQAPYLSLGGKPNNASAFTQGHRDTGAFERGGQVDLFPARPVPARTEKHDPRPTSDRTST